VLIARLAEAARAARVHVAELDKIQQVNPTGGGVSRATTTGESTRARAVGSMTCTPREEENTPQNAPRDGGQRMPRRGPPESGTKMGVCFWCLCGAYLVPEGAVLSRGADQLLLVQAVRQREAAVRVRLRDHVLRGEPPGALGHLAHERRQPVRADGRKVGGMEASGWVRGGTEQQKVCPSSMSSERGWRTKGRGCLASVAA